MEWGVAERWLAALQLEIPLADQRPSQAQVKHGVPVLEVRAF
jgi:hypothetical protein